MVESDLVNHLCVRLNDEKVAVRSKRYVLRMIQDNIDGHLWSPLLLLLQQRRRAHVLRRAVKRSTGHGEDLTVRCDLEDQIVVQYVDRVVQWIYPESRRPL